jgi:exoribonuclease-2
MYALYEENGDFKVGTILADADASLQIESQHGKRQKVKAANVLLRFREPGLSEFVQAAQHVAEDLDVDFLWEASGGEEFAFEELAKDYFGRLPLPAEAAGILFKLHGAPIYFHRKGKGRYKAAPEDTLKLALAAVEKKRLQIEKINGWVAQLVRFEFPAEWKPLLRELLYKPDRNRIETKALEQACTETGLSAPQLIHRCGTLPPSHDYHLGRFLYEYFPRGAGFPADLPFVMPGELPVAEVAAFSLDDAATTEIDDAFSLRRRADGLLEVGIHIAAPALGFAAESALGRVARERLSTVYMPGNKITMLPEAVVAAFTLSMGAVRPALSLYVQVDPASLAIRGTHSRIEAIDIAANLRHQEVDRLNEAFARTDGDPSALDTPAPFVAELHQLYRFARVLEADRGQTGPTVERPEYVFHVENDRVAISERKRGAPLDKLVAELMILVNRTWGKLLADHGVAAIYRSQSQGKVRMSTTPGEHQGLGVAHYAWSSSPLRRYVDLINQWQLAALLDHEAPPFARNSASLLGAIREFELAYAAYAEFQERMEHYWCLRWLLQEGVTHSEATIVRENVVKFRGIPLYIRVSSLPDLPSGSAVNVEVEEVDLVDSTLRAVYKSRVDS